MKKILLFIIGIILLLVPYLFNTYNILRLISVLLGIIIITISLIFSDNKNIYLIIIMPLFLLLLTYSADMFLYSKFSRLPIYIYEIKSNEQISTYNSIFYRIYNCNNELTLDYGYQKKYVCDNSLLDEIDINTFLINPEESYQNNKNKFIKITGKISKIIGRESIELNSYNATTNSLNGYVTFNNDYKISVILDEDLSMYRIYDYVTVIGRVADYKDKTIILDDAYTIASDIYNEFTYDIKTNSNLDLINLVSNYYLYGINTINVIYDPNTIYELRYLITDGKIDIDNIIGDNGGEILRDEDNNIIAKKYELNDFNVLVCENDKNILANKSFELNKDLCY